MTLQHPLGALLALGLGVAIGACSIPGDSESGLRDYAERADRACRESYQRGLAGEQEAERLARENGWSDNEAEAQIRYAWARALEGQYRLIFKLGMPPTKAGALRRWHKTILQRARIYRRWGNAWRESNRELEGEYSISLDYAKARADRLADPFPFQICGTKPPGGHDMPSNAFRAVFPLNTRRYLNEGMKVYRRHQVVGEVVDLTIGGTGVVGKVKIKPRFVPLMPGTDFQVYKAPADPNASWVALVPDESGMAR